MSVEGSTIEIKPGSERSFGVVFVIVFAVIGLFPLIAGGEMRIWSVALSVLFGAVTAVRPTLLARPNYWWFRFGLLLGAIVAPIVMGVVYLVAIVPIGLVMRSLGKDPLRTRIDKGARSYWIARETPLQPMKNQF